MEAKTPREQRADNYRIKSRSNFSCEGCGAKDQLLAVKVKATGGTGVVCEARCLDKRSHEVLPGQWDEAERLREQLAKKAA